MPEGDKEGAGNAAFRLAGFAMELDKFERRAALAGARAQGAWAVTLGHGCAEYVLCSNARRGRVQHDAGAPRLEGLSV